MYVCLLLDLNKFDPERFHPPGLDFRGKLIGIEDVPDARGDKMCQVVFDCVDKTHYDKPPFSMPYYHILLNFCPVFVVDTPTSWWRPEIACIKSVS